MWVLFAGHSIFALPEIRQALLVGQVGQALRASARWKEMRQCFTICTLQSSGGLLFFGRSAQHARIG